MMKRLSHVIPLFFIHIYAFRKVESEPLPNYIFSHDQNGGKTTVCGTVQFLLNSNFTVSCLNETYPVDTRNLDTENNKILCLALYDLSEKWCTKISQHIKLPKIKDSRVFDAELSKIPSEKIGKFCELKKIPINSMLSDALREFYSVSHKCILQCTNSKRENESFKKICFALFWLDDILRTHNEIIAEFRESTSDGMDNGATDVPSENSENPGMKSVNLVGTIELSSPAKNDVSMNQDNLKNVDKMIQTNSESSSVNEAGNGALSDNQKESVGEENKYPENSLENDKKGAEGSEMGTIQQVSAPGNPDELNIVSSNRKEISSSQVNKKFKESQTFMEPKFEIASENTKNAETVVEDVSSIFQRGDIEGEIASDSDQLNQSQEQALLKNKAHYRTLATEDESHSFFYFAFFSLMIVCFYLGYHNKKKILAIILEGKRKGNGRSRRRPSTSSYRKLECNLEGTIASKYNSNVSHVIY